LAQVRFFFGSNRAFFSIEKKSRGVKKVELGLNSKFKPRRKFDFLIFYSIQAFLGVDKSLDGTKKRTKLNFKIEAELESSSFFFALTELFPMPREAKKELKEPK
jgi:hypothetical protein